MEQPVDEQWNDRGTELQVPFPYDEDAVTTRDQPVAPRVISTPLLLGGAPQRLVDEVCIRERVSQQVPVTREEVTVERRPVNDRMASADIGDDAIRIPVTQEEVVVEKRPVVQEQIVIRKHAVQDTQLVDEEVRKERVDIDDRTRRAGHPATKNRTMTA